jgi:hypothetical protein
MSLEFALVLLEHGADMKARDDDDEYTPLLLASRSVLTPFSDTAQIQKHGTNTMRAHWSGPVHYVE